MSDVAPEISVVIPIYNEEAILADSVVELLRGFAAAGMTAEAEVAAFQFDAVTDWELERYYERI